MVEGTGTRAAIWDVDGTLVDTAELHFRAWERVCHELGRPFSRADFAATFGRRNPEILRHLFGDRFDESRVAAIGERKEELYRDMARMGVEPLPGVLPLLKDLQRAGWRQAIGSSAPPANLDLILGLLAVRNFFDAIISGDETQRGKPHPDVFLLAANKLAIPPAACVVLEDAVAGVEAAHAAGMKCVAVRFVGHHPTEKLRQAGADLVVDSL